MSSDDIRRPYRLRRILLVILFSTLPCYLLGGLVLWVGGAVRDIRTQTPSQTPLVSATILPTGTPLTPTETSTATLTETGTATISPTASATFFIPPTKTPTLTVASATPVPPTATATATSTPVPPTLVPPTLVPPTLVPPTATPTTAPAPDVITVVPTP